MSHATVEDLEARWELLGDRKARAEALLADASAIVDSAIGDREVDEDVLRIVVCSMVMRRMMSSTIDGISSTQMTVGPFNQSLNFANPTGDWYFTKQEKGLLGLDRQRITTLHPMIRGVDD